MDLLGLLAQGELTVEGRLTVASNVTLLGEVSHGGRQARCVYKPIAGERPLWDFPDGTLAAREVAAYLVSEAAAWHVVPPTVWRDDGPFGPGMCQLWLDQPDDAGLIDVVAPDGVQPGWLPVMEAMDSTGAPVVVVHADRPELRLLALFDAVVNNADRKGGHVLVADTTTVTELASVVWVDHGVSFHHEPKLRTVLWGWADAPLTGAERAGLEGLREELDGALGARLAELLSVDERAALHARITALLQRGRLPTAGGRMPVPWPIF